MTSYSNNVILLANTKKTFFLRIDNWFFVEFFFPYLRILLPKRRYACVTRWELYKEKSGSFSCTCKWRLQLAVTRRRLRLKSAKAGLTRTTGVIGRNYWERVSRDVHTVRQTEAADLIAVRWRWRRPTARSTSKYQKTDACALLQRARIQYRESSSRSSIVAAML